MKVEFVMKNILTRAGDIKIGECFMHANTLYMRTEGNFSSAPGRGSVRMVEIENGHENGIDSQVIVFPVEMRCIRVSSLRN